MALTANLNEGVACAHPPPGQILASGVNWLRAGGWVRDNKGLAVGLGRFDGQVKLPLGLTEVIFGLNAVAFQAETGGYSKVLFH